jgi:hypothetical protein
VLKSTIRLFRVKASRSGSTGPGCWCSCSCSGRWRACCSLSHIPVGCHLPRDGAGSDRAVLRVDPGPRAQSHAAGRRARACMSARSRCGCSAACPAPNSPCPRREPSSGWSPPGRSRPPRWPSGSGVLPRRLGPRAGPMALSACPTTWPASTRCCSASTRCPPCPWTADACCTPCCGAARATGRERPSPRPRPAGRSRSCSSPPASSACSRG